MISGPNAIQLIQHYEGLRLEAYLCPAGVPTIGYGHTGNDVKLGMKITAQRACEFLMSDLKRFEAVVNSLVKVPLTQNQFDALVSFTYNLGEKSLAKSTLLVKVNESRFDEAASEFSKWVKAKGVSLPGLVKRRQAEAELFKSQR